jgi:site-specific DNA-cytosine methylase
VEKRLKGFAPNSCL